MVERSLLFFVGICANLKLCARKKHLCVTEHLCLEIPQKKATPPTIFRYGLLQNDIKFRYTDI
jgi:hypothetical protein